MVLIVPSLGSATIPDKKIDDWARQYVSLYRSSAILPNLAVKIGIAKNKNLKHWPARLRKKALESIVYLPKSNTFKFGDGTIIKILDLNKKIFEANGKVMVFPKDFQASATKKKSAHRRHILDVVGIVPSAYARDSDQDSSSLHGCNRMGVGSAVRSVLYDFAVFRETLNVYPTVFFMAKMADAYAPIYSDSCREQIDHVNRLLRENNAELNKMTCHENIIEIDTGGLKISHDIYRGSSAFGPWLVEHSALRGDSYQAYANPFGMVMMECGEGSEGLRSARAILNPYLPALNYMAKKSFCYKCTDPISVDQIRNLSSQESDHAPPDFSTQ